MFKRILVVCVGNICRSPTAECLLHHALHDKGFTVSSAGLSAVKGSGVEKNAASVLENNGYQWANHIARQLNRQIINENDLILVMEQRHLQDVLKIAPEARGKTFLLGKWIDNQEIPDPYRHSYTMFEQVFTLIKKATDNWATRLAP